MLLHRLLQKFYKNSKFHTLLVLSVILSHFKNMSFATTILITEPVRGSEIRDSYARNRNALPFSSPLFLLLSFHHFPSVLLSAKYQKYQRNY